MELKARQRDWRQVMPVLAIKDGIIVSRRGELTLGWEIALPVAYSLSEQDYDSLILRYYEAVRRLPPWTVLHRQDVYLRDEWHPDGAPRWSRSFLQDCSDRHFDGRQYLTHRAFLWLTASGRSSLSRRGRDSGYFGFRISADMPDGRRMAEFASVAREFISSAFEGSGVKAEPLGSADLEGDGDTVGLIQLIASFGDSSPLMTDYEEGRDYVQYRDHRAIAFTVSQSSSLPTEVCTTSQGGMSPEGSPGLFLSYASPIGILLPCEHIVNHYIVVPPQDQVLGDLEARKARMTSGITSSDNRVNAAQIGEYIDDVNRLGLFTVRSSVSLIAWDSPSRQDELRSVVSSALSSMKVRAVCDKLDTPLMWYASIPGAEAELGMENYIPMELLSSLCLSTWETFDRGFGEGTVRLVDRLRHIPVTVDTQVSALERQLITNYNACVFGASGSGKSFFMNMYMRNCYDRGEHVCIIDVGDSYEGLCSIIREESGGRDGVYYSWDASHPFAFNPFAGFRGDGTADNPGWLSGTGAIRQDENGVNFMLSFLMTAYTPREGWTEQNSTVVVSLLENFIWTYVGKGSAHNPIFDDFYTWVNDVAAPLISGRDGKGYFIHSVRVTPEIFDVEGFILALEAYSLGGRFGFLLNERNPEDLFSSRFTVFEVDALSNVRNDSFYSICILCIMNAFDVKMRREKAFKVLAIEEAWKAIANRTMAPYLAGLWKTSRKFRVSAMVVTQQMSDILSSEVIRDTILQNSAVRILLDQRNNRGIFPQIREMLALDETDSSLALSVGGGVDPRYGHYKEVFVKLGDSFSSVYAVEASPEEALAYESDKVRKRPFLDLGAEVGYREAARRIVSNRNKQ